MTKELNIILQVVSGKTEINISPAEIDIPRMIRLSSRHKVVYQMLLFAQKHPELFSEDQLRKLNDRNRKVAMQSLVQLREMKMIAGIFNEKNIGYICIKGPQLSRMLYGREALKESVDLDIILSDVKDLQFVHGLLGNKGYVQSNLNDYPGQWRRKLFLVAKREVHYHNPEKNLSIDLHIRPGANTYLTENNFRPFLNDLQSFDLDGISVPIPEPNSYFVYLCYHGALHQFVRIAWLLDVRMFLLSQKQNLDIKAIFELAQKVQIENCVLLALFLLKEHFGDQFFNPSPSYPASVKWLAKRCIAGWESKPGYSRFLRGRFDKVVFIMRLLKGLPAKIDWIYGILVRQLIKLPLIRRR